MPDTEQLSQQVLDSLIAEVAVLDREGTIIAVNKAWRRFAAENGGSQDTTGVGVNYLDVCRRCQGDELSAGQQVCEGIEQVLNGTLDVFEFEYPCHSQTEQRWFLLYVSRLEGSDYVVTNHLPITERKQTELQLIVAERLGAIGEAMRGLSHEGRNALQRAQAHIALLRLQVEGNPDALELIQKIEDAQQKLIDLYEEVRSYAAPLNLQFQPCRLDQLAEDAWQSSQPADASWQFTMHLDQTVDTNCQVDAGAVHEVFKSLIDNAVAASDNVRKIELDFIDDRLGGDPAVTVVFSDYGSGIGVEIMETAFDPFFTTKTHGTGLGLAICERIVAEHHGRIQFGTPLRGNTSIYVSFPRRQSSR